jgi:phosphoribosylformimino-5-aminoimidazole carboxamide ribotide isomerase
VEIIPVIDLLHGKVVRAQRGERDRYLPIDSPLCNSSEPVDVIRALTELYPFTTLYIADLNAIQRLGNNSPAIQELHGQFPDLELWLDAGISDAASWPFPIMSNLRCIVGSETLSSAEQYTQLASQLHANRPVLSLDFNNDGLLGPQQLLNPKFWPDTMICMTLAKVGSYEGPDFLKLADMAARDPKRQVYAAGGIRDIDDLKRLDQAGIAGALIASALHDGKISAIQLAELMT